MRNVGIHTIELGNPAKEWMKPVPMRMEIVIGFFHGMGQDS